MEVLDLSNELNNLRFRGINLNLDEKMQLELAIHKLHQETSVEELLLWGKVNGLKYDYFVVVGLIYSDQFEFLQKKFYYCLSSDYVFMEMPNLNDQHVDFVNRDNGFFRGEPNRKLKQPVEGEEEAQEAPEEANEEEEDGAKKELDSNESEAEEIKVPPKELTEIDRLNYVVYAIENDCQIAPLGAFKMTSQHQVRRNEAFRGLGASESLNLTQYVHFRNVQDESKKAQLDLPSAPFNKNFLESIEADKPSGCWNFQHDLQKETVLGRSLIWPGYHFYHKHNQNKFGSIYIGDGLKNLELQFQTQ